MSATSFHKQSGVMLLEALIALLIFSIGILAMIGMQAISIKNSASATYRSEASYLANQIISQMWSDQANLATYALTPATAVCAAGNSVTANANVNSWLTNDVRRLPLGSAPALLPSLQHSIVITPVTNVVTVTLCWQGPSETSPHNFVATAQIN